MKYFKKQSSYLYTAILLGAAVFIVLTIALFSIYISGLYHDNSFNRFLLSLILLFLALIVAMLSIRKFVYYRAKKTTFEQLSSFEVIDSLNTYKITLAQLFVPEKKYDHIVLLLHGFSASTDEFKSLLDTFRQQNIAFFTPTILGFGLTDFHLLNHVQAQDLFREMLTYFDCLAAVANKVSIVGHSFGAVLATYIAEHRDVYRLILTAPGLNLLPEDEPIMRLLLHPIKSKLIFALFPCLPKTIRKTLTGKQHPIKLSYKRFQYTSIPTQAIKMLLLAKDAVSLSKIKPTNVSIIYGDQDRIVDVPACLADMKRDNLSASIICIPNAGHHLFEGSEKEAACEAVITAIKNQLL